MFRSILNVLSRSCREQNILKIGASNITLVDNSTTLCSNDLKWLFPVWHSFKLLHTTVPRSKDRDRRYFLQNVKKLDEGTEGEKLLGMDAIIEKREDMFTDERTPHLLFNGVPFTQVPICHVRITKNNTIILITDHNGTRIAHRSCGMEGFKNSRKGTNVAAQATAITVGTQAVNKGIIDVRLKLKGLGPGRMSAVKGLVMGGLNIISVTDDTRVAWWYMPRPKKVRRL